MDGIQIHLTYEERCELINDICKVYDYSIWNKKELHKRSDNQLLAYRESLRERGLLPGYVKGPSIHMRVFLNEYKANAYDIRVYCGRTRFYVGFISEETDKFGQIKQYQYGYIDINDDWIIVETEMYGEQLKRYNGLRLIIDGKK